MKEVWKDIKGYEGLYQVSNFGRVKSMNKKISANNRSWEAKGKILKLGIRNTYHVINLYKNGFRKSFQVHRLVAEAFIPNPNNYDIVNHIDEKPLNNNINNLEWCNQKYNVQHSSYKMCKQRNIIYSDTGEKYISKSISYTTKKGKKYKYDYFRVIIKQLNFDNRYKTLNKAIEVRNEKLKELEIYYKRKRTTKIYRKLS